MTARDVLKRVDEIAAIAGRGDYEVAHSEEDKLHRDVLQEIADRRINGATARKLAHAALATRGLSFPRWMA